MVTVVVRSSGHILALVVALVHSLVGDTYRVLPVLPVVSVGGFGHSHDDGVEVDEAAPDTSGTSTLPSTSVPMLPVQSGRGSASAFVTAHISHIPLLLGCFALYRFL